MHLIVSDIHGSGEAVELIKAAARNFGAEGIISAGDQCPDEGNASFYSSLIAVRGNCDRFYEYVGVPFPPISKELKLYGRRIVITHGDRMSKEDFLLSPGDVFVSGHTHAAELYSDGGVAICNPGSPSRPRSSMGPTAALLSEEGVFLFSLLDFTILKALDFSSL